MRMIRHLRATPRSWEIPKIRHDLLEFNGKIAIGPNEENQDVVGLSEVLETGLCGGRFSGVCSGPALKKKSRGRPPTHSRKAGTF